MNNKNIRKRGTLYITPSDNEQILKKKVQVSFPRGRIILVKDKEVFVGRKNDKSDNVYDLKNLDVDDGVSILLSKNVNSFTGSIWKEGNLKSKVELKVKGLNELDI